MSQSRRVQNDSGKSTDVNFVGQSPHVFAYRMWYRTTAKEEWVKFGEGTTEDDIPDHNRAPALPDGTQITTIVAVGGKKSSYYRFVVTLSQEGKIVQGGAISIAGRTSEDGGTAKKVNVVLV